MTNFKDKTLQLRSLVSADGQLELSLAEVAIAQPEAEEIVVRIEASPLNPSDLGLLLAGADMTAAQGSGTADRPVLKAAVPARAMASMGPRMGESMPVGNEGAGVVVAAGSSEAAQALMGRTVAILPGAAYSQFRTVKARDALVLPQGVTPAQGASAFVNPLTALGMVETMRMENHKALVHTAAASNLGQMLNRLCQKDGVALVNIVRSAEQVALLKGEGATHVCDSTAPDFRDQLVDALVATGATLAFDAIGGGPLAGQILGAMEVAANKTAKVYSRYGSSTHKQLYIYGALDLRPTELNRNFGMAWGVGGWLLTPFMMKAGPEKVAALRQRVGAEITTTFASHYSRTISLAQALDPQIAAAYDRRATGEKYLINPNLGLA